MHVIRGTYLKDGDGKRVSKVLVPTQDHPTILPRQVGTTDLVRLSIDPVQTVIHVVCKQKPIVWKWYTLYAG